MGKSEVMRQQHSKSHTSVLNTLDFEYVYTDKKAKTLCAIHTCKIVQKFSVGQWTLHTLDKQHVGGAVEVALASVCILANVSVYLM